MQLTGKNLKFKHENRSNPITILVLIFLCVLSLFLLKAVVNQTLVSPWLPTAVPTRDAISFAMEGDTYFKAGNLQKAADSYAAASVLEPSNSEYAWKRGRALIYLTGSQTTDAEKTATLLSVIETMEPQLDVYAEDSNIYAILAFAYNWYADADLCGADNVETNLGLAENYIRRAVDYDSALEMFSKAARIDDQLGITDPMPYIAIGNTYSQTGDFYAAGLNIKKALQINPYNADVYGRLGVNYYKARNYEAAIEALKCVVEGCGALESCTVRECADEGNPVVEIEQLPISSSTVTYYFSYVGALAYMHTNANRYCETAMKVAAEIEAVYPDDESVMSIVRDGQAICRNYGY